MDRNGGPDRRRGLRAGQRPIFPSDIDTEPGQPSVQYPVCVDHTLAPGYITFAGNVCFARVPFHVAVSFLLRPPAHRNTEWLTDTHVHPLWPMFCRRCCHSPFRVLFSFGTMALCKGASKRKTCTPFEWQPARSVYLLPPPLNSLFRVLFNIGPGTLSRSVLESYSGTATLPTRNRAPLPA